MGIGWVWVLDGLMGIEWALTHNPSGIVPAPRRWHLLPTNVIPVYMELGAHVPVKYVQREGRAG